MFLFFIAIRDSGTPVLGQLGVARDREVGGRGRRLQILGHRVGLCPGVIFLGGDDSLGIAGEPDAFVRARRELPLERVLGLSGLAA